MIVNYNLPPDEHVKEENLILAGVIPGSNQPADMNSFLRPLINKFHTLEKGISVWDAYRQQDRMLWGFLFTIAGDQLAREKLMGILRQNTKYYCSYCKIKGVWNRYNYCCFTTPTDIPDEVLRHIADLLKLPLRTNTEHRKDAHYIMDTNDKEYREQTGIKELSIFLELESVVFPWSFGIDIMHLLYENIVKQMFNHWRGKFFIHEKTEETGSKPQKFKQSGEPYCIPKAIWLQVGEVMKRSQHTFPGLFDDTVRSISNWSHGYKSGGMEELDHSILTSAPCWPAS